ncbi:glycosyltransferase [Cohaesibacter intestini]|uniref:capsular polysaccharide export protein, LipB/KpsS family n=1 Tax=Cohaesibacter intestini TaxID=2211145 RepID=UPI000DE8EC2D|nr:glycosyltransferase [Cohaesibacter intestini]
MTANHKDAYLNFLDLIEIQQKEAVPEEIDIREEILSLQDEPIGIGYTKNTLEDAYGAHLKLLFPESAHMGEPRWHNASTYLALGTLYPEPEKSHKGATRVFNRAKTDTRIILFEQGFLASTSSWSHSFNNKDTVSACLGYVYDDISHYFMADYPNRLIHRLNSSKMLSDEETSRARTVINRICERKISKYNSQPIHQPTMTEGYESRVLVVDQSFADASTIYGKVDEIHFEAMLLAAIRENPDSEILVKTHPDTVWEEGKRVGYYNHLKNDGRVRILRDPINPFCLFELVDKVYVGTSGMGLEALLAGKEVICFGAPFYAGWGLTDDRQKIPYRHRSRTLEEIFHYFYIWYTIYHVPGKPAPSEIEDVLDYIEANRPVTLPGTMQEVASEPKVSVILPVYGVEAYIEEAIQSIQRQSLREVEIIPVNDCSPDNSQAIIDRMAAEDPRIKPIVLQENVGQGFARNRGLEAALGEYVWFLDPDDYFPSTTHLETVYEIAISDTSDMVRGRKLIERIEDTNGNFIKYNRDKTEDFFEENLSKTTFDKSPVLLHSRHFCLWLYRLQFLKENNIKFVNTQWEERPFLTKALVRAKSISTSSSEAFVYRIRKDSTARRQKNSRDYDLQMENLEHTIKLLVGNEAFGQDHPYAYHLRFTVAQYLQFLFRGFAYKLVQSGVAADDNQAFLARIKRVFEPIGMSPDQLSRDPIQLSQPHLDANAYGLLYAAILADRPDFVDIATNLEPIDQQTLYENLLSEPKSETERHFLSALNLYARNDKIKPGNKVVAAIKEASSGLAKTDRHDRIRVIFHIGSTKTGSTYLQHLMEQNRPELLRQGIWYPSFGLFWQAARPHKQAGHAHFAPAAVQGKRELRELIEEGLVIFSKMKNPIHTIIISSEAFFLNEKAPALVDYFDGFDVSMITYLRRQDEWANAQYAEFVAGGAVGRVDSTMADWLESDITKRRLDYHSIIQLWAQKLDPSKIIVRPFERSQMVDRDLLSDFSYALDLPQLLALPQPTEDKSNAFPLENSHIRIVRQFNKLHFESRGHYFRFIEEVTVGISEGRAKRNLEIGRPWLLTTKQSEHILAQYQNSNAMIAKIFLGRSDGKLFDNYKPKIEMDTSFVIDIEEYELIAEAYQRNCGKKNQHSSSKKKSPPASESDYRKGLAAFHAGKYKGSLIHFMKAIETKTHDALIRRCIAEVLIKLNRPFEAIPHLEIACEQLPGNKNVRRRLREVKYPLFRRISNNKPFLVPKS